MGRKTKRIDYTVYVPNYQPGAGCWDFRTLSKAKSAARGLGSGSRVYRNFSLESKRGKIPRGWWSSKFYWMWNGRSFVREIDHSIEATGLQSMSESVTLPRFA